MSSTSSTILASARARNGKAKFGNQWTSSIYFDSHADDKYGPKMMISELEFAEEVDHLMDIHETIIEVTVYKLPLSGWQISKFILYHNFIVFETATRWWSIEKNSEGITIQRSERIEAVRDMYRQGKRIRGRQKIAVDSSTKTIGDLLDWLCKENELNKRYNYLFSNCKHFAKSCFNYVAESKQYPSWF